MIKLSTEMEVSLIKKIGQSAVWANLTDFDHFLVVLGLKARVLCRQAS